jgi:hypothetical protein
MTHRSDAHHSDALAQQRDFKSWHGLEAPSSLRLIDPAAEIIPSAERTSRCSEKPLATSCKY